MATSKKTQSVGRPTLYKKEYVELCYKFCLLGADDNRLAEMLEVDVATIYRWKLEYPEFCESLKAGKDVADSKVAQALYNRALGYSHPEVDIKVIDGHIVQTQLTKHYPPDTGAAMAWLKNRQPKTWRDKQDIDHTSSDNSMSSKPAIELDAKMVKSILEKISADI